MNIQYEMYKKFGAHLEKQNELVGTHFAVWAPNAKQISVVGDFNEWNKETHILDRVEDGVFEGFILEAKESMQYKYCITTQDEHCIFKADPFAYSAELRPGTKSIISDLCHLEWTDQEWMEERKYWNCKVSPLAIYEVHIGSWKRKEKKDVFYTYRDFAHEIADYVIQMGYTHIELMGILEYPYDGSWGYQVTGYFAPTSRYGSPQDFAYMINYLHQKKIGVLLDWVPAHFANDEHGLYNFDGTPLFEYADKKQGDHAEWGTKVFDYGKDFVRSFLISNALFWIDQYHIDGLRVDAVASMIYLNYGKNYSEYRDHEDDGRYNLEAIELLKQLNFMIQKQYHGVIVIAEDSSTFPKVTSPVETGGLGFHLKWNMGWMHDFTEYLAMNQEERRKNHYHMTFASSYMQNENYLLVLSHDEVVHLKKSMLNKINGFMDEKFADLKTAYAFMMGHPGKKLLFMGQEFAQYSEWNEKKELDWYLLKDRRHKGIQSFWKDLLSLYQNNPALFQLDYDSSGFEWLNADDKERSVYSFVRRSESQKERFMFICNFSCQKWTGYRVGVPEPGAYQLILNSDEIKYDGDGRIKNKMFIAELRNCNGRSFSFECDLQPHSALIFTF